MAVDRTLNSNLGDAREAFINVCVDTIGEFWLVDPINTDFWLVDRAVEDAAVYQPARSVALLSLPQTAATPHSGAAQVSSIYHQVAENSFCQFSD